MRRMTWLVVTAVIVAACGEAGTQSDPTDLPTVLPSAPSASETSPDPADAAPSQTVADAVRDGVVPALAALPFPVRVDVLADQPASEGVWVLARPTPAAEQLSEGCRLGAADGKYPTEFICTFEYGEVLLLDEAAARILRAYPMPSVPPQFLAVTDDAVFCARGGALPMTDAMVCRIDRATLTIAVVVFPDPEASTTQQPCFFPPDTWTFADEHVAVAGLEVNDRGVWLDGGDGTWTQLDATTLAVIARGTAGPTE